MQPDLNKAEIYEGGAMRNPLTPDGTQIYILTPDRTHEIAVPFWLKRTLIRRKVLIWDEEAELWRITGRYFQVFDLLKWGGVNNPPPRASDPSRSRTSPIKGGKVDPVFKYLGADCRGPSHARRIAKR